MIRTLKCRVNHLNTTPGSKVIQINMTGELAVDGSLLGWQGRGDESYIYVEHIKRHHRETGGQASVDPIG